MSLKQVCTAARDVTRVLVILYTHTRATMNLMLKIVV